jgi:ubiquinone/menaquinone biosynthesis C-methylase UbiE
LEVLAENTEREKKLSINSIETKKSNILLHDIEARFYERMRLEIFNEYEERRVARNLSLIDQLFNDRMRVHPKLCIDVGTGTGNLSRFELCRYDRVVATDISANMCKTARAKIESDAIDHVVCDAENLPFREEIASLISMFSVLHHLPAPLCAMREILRCLEKGGLVYIDHEPRHLRFRFFSDFMHMLMSSLILLLGSFFGKQYVEGTSQQNLDHSKTDVQSQGFRIEDLALTLKKIGMKIIFAESYYWLSPIYLVDCADFWRLSQRYRRVATTCLIKANFLLEKLPFFGKLGRAICVIAKK